MRKYVCVLATNDYLDGCLVLNENLKHINSKYGLLCLINENIDEETRKTVISFLRKKAENRTVLLITHNKEDAEDCGAEQILHLSLGPTS